jgi:hypothetical protein
VSGLVVPVLVEGWQYECCGVAPAVGQQVAWRLVLRDEDWPDVAVDLPVDAAPLEVGLADEWRGLGNDPGRDPVVARTDGLTVLVPDARVLVAGRMRGVLQEDHHVDAPTGLAVTTGTVERVYLVSRQLRHQGVRTVVRVPRTQELVEVASAPDYLLSEDPPEGALVWRSTSDVLVDLRVDPPVLECV